MKSKRRNNKKSVAGLVVLILGVICLIISLAINRYVDIADIFCVILMILSLAIEISGLLLIIKGSKD